MAEDRKKSDRLGGEFMIQDRDHMSETGQMGGEAGQGGRQSEQSHGEGRQQGGGQHQGSGQQGGERSKRRSKLL